MCFKRIVHKCFLATAGLCLLLSSCGAGQQLPPRAEEASGFQLDERLERIRMKSMEGEPFTLGAYAGRPVFLNFWASWCAPCISEMGSVAEIFSQYGADITFLAVSTDDLSTIRQFKEKHGFPFPFAQLEGDYIDAFIIKLPTTLLISRDGRLMFEEEGFRVWTTDALRRKVEALIK